MRTLLHARFCAALAGLAVSWTSAAVIVAPAGTEDISLSSLNTPIRNASRVYQEYFAASNFSAITQPSVITGMRFRLAIGDNWRPSGYVGQTWPDVGITWASYDVQLSKPSAQLVSAGEYLSLSPTFASYQDGGLTTVRSGVLSIGANSYSADGANPATDIHSFGPSINFTAAYPYTPGDGLVMMTRLSGYTGNALQAFVGSRAFENGVCDAISSTSSNTATTPSGFSDPVFVQFTYTVVPEPVSAAMISVAGLLLVSRRR